MRAQAKSVEAFAANPIRARILAREIERSILNVCPPKEGRYCRLQHVTQFIDLNEVAEDNASLRRAYSRWLKGGALPSSGTRARIDEIFEEPLGSIWGERKLDSPEQTLLVALDIISKSSPPNTKEILMEADSILETAGKGFCSYIPKMVRLERPRTTSYQGLILNGKKIRKNKSVARYNSSGKRIAAYPYISERINFYNPISPLCAGLLYLVKPNSIFVHDDESAFKMLCDFLSGSIAAYIIMLHRNPEEFKNGGLVVNLYRLAFTFFLDTETSKSKKSKSLLHEVFYNEFPEFKGKDGELESIFVRLISLFKKFGEKAGMNIEELVRLIAPMNPDDPKAVCSWWREEF